MKYGGTASKYEARVRSLHRASTNYARAGRGHAEPRPERRRRAGAPILCAFTQIRRTSLSGPTKSPKRIMACRPSSCGLPGTTGGSTRICVGSWTGPMTSNPSPTISLVPTRSRPVQRQSMRYRRRGALLTTLRRWCQSKRPYPTQASRADLWACSKINESECTVEQALSFCFERQLCRRADALICRRCLWIPLC
jgi:hypothetical protein